MIIVKARFITEQQPVRIINYNDKLYVFICLNGVQTICVSNDYDGTSCTEECIEYDYNEFIVDIDDIDVDDIKNHPERYLNYPLPPVSQLEQLRADVDYLLMVSE